MTRSIFLLSLSLTFALTASAGTRPNGEAHGRSSHWTRLAASLDHTCAIPDDGRVVCWGDNSVGQLGDGSVSTRTSPVLVASLATAVSVAAGPAHTCALTIQSVVNCWGANTFGELGNNSFSNSSVPVGAIGLNSVVAIAAGTHHSCAVRVDGTVWCWGDNNYGELGIAQSSRFSAVPVQVPNVAGAVAIAAGIKHTCVLLVNGTVQCWGTNDRGQLGNGGSPSISFVPVAVSNLSPLTPLAGVEAVDISAGDEFTCARLSDSTVSCWGSNSNGQLGNGSFGGQANRPVVSSGNLVVAVGTGSIHTCVILVNGTVECWGADSSGQLGDGGTDPLTTPGPPVPTVVNAVEISGGAGHTCATSVNGTIQCWGRNNLGQHGDGGTNPVGFDSVSGISGLPSGRGVVAGNLFTCARRGTGAAACWGGGADGELGNSTFFGSSNPVAVIGLNNALGLTAGGGHACIVDTAGGAKCWGENFFGELGNGASGSGTNANHPVAVTGSVPLVSISAGLTHTCAVTVDGLVQCWGSNSDGELGSNDTNPSAVPLQVVGIANVVAVAAGSRFTCALEAQGIVECWGSNLSNQLGDGGAEQFQKIPKLVPGLSNIVGISAGLLHMCAVSVFGTVSCWGFNDEGQIGNNSTQIAPFQTTVQGLTDAISVSAGGGFTCAARTFSVASCWGSNFWGELAAADSLGHLTPTAVIGGFVTVRDVSIPQPLFPVVAVATGRSDLGPEAVDDLQQACALLSSGAITCWGKNTFGALGDGTEFDRSRPTVVNSFTANVAPTVTLESNSRIAIATALINCETGGEAHLTLTLTQGDTFGTGRAVIACADRMLREPMTIPPRGPDGFHAGAAVATVEALVTDSGGIVQDQHWTVNVILTAP